VEFWINARDCVVADCRIGQIYDTGVTIQGHDTDSTVANIYFSNNIIWFCDFASYEVRYNNTSSSIRNIHFENNVCIGAGLGWGDAQGPRDRGWNVQYNTAGDNEHYISSNVFFEAATCFARFWGQGNPADPVVMDYNYYYQASGNMVQYKSSYYTMAQFSSYQSATGLDAHSVTGNKDVVRDKAFSMVQPEDHDLLNAVFQELDPTFVPGGGPAKPTGLRIKRRM
jgi:hypothetical protein